MSGNKINNYSTFLKNCHQLLGDEKPLFLLFLVLSFIAALTEGIGVTMLIPILENQAEQSAFSTVPLLNKIPSLFQGMGVNEKLQKVALILGVILLLRGILLYIVSVLSALIPLRLQKKLFARSYRAILKVEHGYIAEKDIGDHMNCLNDFVIRSSTLIKSLADFLFNSILLLVYLILMLAVSWKLAVTAFIFIFLVTLVLKKYILAHLRNQGKILSARNAGVSEMLFETLSGIKFIKMSAGEDKMFEMYSGRVRDKIKTRTNIIMLSAVTQPFMTTVSGLFICLVLYFGAYLGGGGEEWLSGLLFFLFIVMRLLSPVSQLNSSRANMLAQSNALENLEKFYNSADKRVQPSGEKIFSNVTKGISFHNINFKYPRNSKNSINDLSLFIPAKKLVAIVGPSGAGKSTLVMLLTRFHDPQSGSIKINDSDLADYDIHDYRQKVSVVSQDVFIFNDAVRRNISFPNHDISPELVEEAARRASADEFIKSLPDGYDTMLGDQGFRLSGGQQQRIAIARAILKNPDLLILDEATSHLDTITEMAIQNAVEYLRGDRTIIVIAHRLSTIKRADKVIVMSHGKVVEEGTHDELVKNNGVYEEMVSHQELGLLTE